MGDKGQRPGGGDGRVLLAQGPGGGVAGVGEDLQGRPPPGLPGQVLGAARLVEGVEGLHGEVDLAADLQERGVGVPGQDQGHGGDGAHVAGDVLPHRAVPAGGGAGEQAVLVGQGHGDAVDLDLRGHGQVRVRGGGVGSHPVGPLLDLLQAEDVLEGVHALVVRGRGEVRDGPAADRVRGRGGQVQGRVGGLELLQLTVEQVVLRVRDGALGVHGIVVGVPGGLDGADQLAPALAGGCGDGGQGVRLRLAHGDILPHTPDTPAACLSPP